MARAILFLDPKTLTTIGKGDPLGFWKMTTGLVLFSISLTMAVIS